jgi:excinuclease ABC subunit C
MLREVLQRRLRRGRQALEAVTAHREGAGGDQPASPAATDPASQAATDSFAVLPDLLIVDGGRGQADVAAAALAGEGLEGVIPVYGLAKKQEILYPPGGAPPVVLPQGSGALFTLIRLRDEAHRFALSYHRKVRSRRTLKSILDDIPGVGPARRTALLRHFGSGRAIARASLGELSAVPGIPAPVARSIFERLHKPAPGRDTPEEGRSEDDSKAEDQGPRA